MVPRLPVGVDLRRHLQFHRSVTELRLVRGGRLRLGHRSIKLGACRQLPHLVALVVKCHRWQHGADDPLAHRLTTARGVRGDQRSTWSRRRFLGSLSGYLRAYGFRRARPAGDPPSKAVRLSAHQELNLGLGGVVDGEDLRDSLSPRSRQRGDRADRRAEGTGEIQIQELPHGDDRCEPPSLLHPLAGRSLLGSVDALAGRAELHGALGAVLPCCRRQAEGRFGKGLFQVLGWRGLLLRRAPALRLRPWRGQLQAADRAVHGHRRRHRRCACLPRGSYTGPEGLLRRLAFRSDEQRLPREEHES
mmetsp:Transcript_103770/g.300145  ORF Transcript_103770/g.300145 Transcript_103770/m.300145 type:complete len:304 (+) Transcript_103770:1157-2068(+)